LNSVPFSIEKIVIAREYPKGQKLHGRDYPSIVSVISNDLQVGEILFCLSKTIKKSRAAEIILRDPA